MCLRKIYSFEVLVENERYILLMSSKFIFYRNCVSTVNLGVELNLQNINFRTRNSEYNPSRFHGVVMRIMSPRCTALIFRSGKLVCTGARNESDANLGTRKFARIIQKLGYPVSWQFNDICMASLNYYKIYYLSVYAGAILFKLW